MARKGMDEQAAKKYLVEVDRIRTRRIRELFKIDWCDPTRYDLVLNTAKSSVETAARMIAEVSQREEYRPTAESVQALRSNH
jgi:cytidylate kinase